MQELDDNALLRAYADQRSEEAFAVLVRRHVNKVYSVALRHVRNPHQAGEITQTVFVLLAGKSRRFGKRVILEGWLHQTARLTALSFIRGEMRRAQREQEAVLQNIANEDEADVWRQIAPLLDAAIASLPQTDRLAVVLRFFYGRSMKEVGVALGGTEGAATLRVHRALEKLRRFFVKHRVHSTTDIISGAISGHAVQAAPVALASTAAGLALAKGATASVSSLAFAQGTIKTLASNKATAAAVILAAALFSQATVASHFNLAGNANATMGRSTYLLLSVVLGLGLPALIIALGYLVRFFPAAALNIPHRDYWLAPERRARTYAYFFHQNFRLAGLEAIFLLAFQSLLVQANRQTPPHLSMPLLWGLTGCFLTSVAIWIGAMARHFRRIA